MNNFNEYDRMTACDKCNKGSYCPTTANDVHRQFSRTKHEQGDTGGDRGHQDWNWLSLQN